ncbi:hypothetical protein SNE40_009141 [Patella caerulea]|uniref:G-protein coupled receptors family 1 profile domain-containing protein n=1 Tax=Patella caerulea TaxID=87958 RepID=A0AAN8JUH2_PATCE
MLNFNNTHFQDNQTFWWFYDDTEETDTERFPFATFVGTVASIGLTGNILLFFMTFHKNISQHSYAIYLRITAISDTMVLLQTATEDILDHLGLLTSFHLMSFHFCKVWLVCYSLFRTTSPWFVVTLSLDRCIAIWKPLQRSRYCSKKAAWVICLIIGCVAFVGTVAVLSEALTDVGVSDESCGEIHVSDVTLKAGTYFNLFLQSTLPCVFLLILNIMVAIQIIRSLKFRRSFSAEDSNSTRAAIRTTLPLILVSVLAFVTLLPVSITGVYEMGNILNRGEEYEFSFHRHTVDTVWAICNIIYLINFAQNFYILFGSSNNYRCIMRDMVCKCSYRAGRPTV